MILQPILDIASLCAMHGVEEAILSPGSRCAPLTLAFVRHQTIRCRTISDERSAAFIALGMAQRSQKPVVLICTSGTAAYNYAPAIAEAYYQQIPLLVLTADRPPEWIGQRDGQTIQQQNLYGDHVKAAYQLPASYKHADAQWQVHRIVQEALHLSQQPAVGPVHINVPLREPFYPQEGEQWEYNSDLVKTEYWPAKQELSQAQWQQLAERWKGFKRKLVIGGQMPADNVLQDSLAQTSRIQKIPVLADVISNLHGLPNAITQQDSFLSRADDWEALQPDLLITFGQSVISKNTKLFLRHYRPKAHWHIEQIDRVPDPFQSLSLHLPLDPGSFFHRLNNQAIKAEEHIREQAAYRKLWMAHEKAAKEAAASFFDGPRWGEFQAVRQTLKAASGKVQLHLANSTAVRYANFIGLGEKQKGVQVWANRGTSGIDGSSSTTVGHALADPKNLHLLITGDLAFFYDRNAFWNNYLPDNLRILLLNNHAGGIFRLIQGPGNQPELEEFFETRQALNAELTACNFNMRYFSAKNLSQFEEALAELMEPEGGAGILEVETESEQNARLLKKYKEAIQAYTSPDQ